jgi:peptide/nickel transport system ATP-binding protein
MSTETAIRLGGRLVIMRQGRIVEEGPLSRLTTAQAHVYTQTLFKENVARERTSARGHAVVQALGISLAGGPRGKSAARGRAELNFELCRGASLALIGEEGSGRRALTRQILGMSRPERGRIIFDAVDLGILSEEMISRLRRRVAVIAGADNVLDPRMSLWETVAEPLRTHLQLPRDVLASYRDAALRRVGLASLSGQMPIGALSAFDRRRLQVARAIVTAPALAIIDEPFRGLDAFARSVIRDLLQSFRDEEGPAFLVITSDFAVAKALAEDAMVFRDSQVIERGTIAELTRAPKNPYTRMLVEASKLDAPPILPDKPIVADAKPSEADEAAPGADVSDKDTAAGEKTQSETGAETAV